MTLHQLGEEYLRQAEDLHTLISGYSAQMRNLSGIRLYEMNSKITALREMERDTRIIGKQLTSYYDISGEKRQYFRHKNKYE
ncbi:MAG: hypothetical protein ACI4SX_06855 [Candidatus Fimenecus sp.]